MKINLTKIVVFFVTFAEIAFAQVKNVAVIEAELDVQSGVAESLTKAEVREITTELRRQAAKNLPRDKYNVMTSETVQAQGSAVLQDCFEENCMITLGSKIGADYIVRGVLSKFQKRFTLSVEIYDTEDGNLVASSNPVRSENIDELLDESAEVCAKMYKDFIRAYGSTSATQDKGERKFHFGIIGGIGFPSLKAGDRDADYLSSSFAFMTGLNIIRQITVKWADFEIEAGVSFSKWTFTKDINDDLVGYTFEIMGIDIPVLIRYNIIGGFYAGAGLKIGIPFSADITREFSDPKYAEDNWNYYDLSDYLNTEVSFLLNVGYRYKMFFASLKYFSPLNKFCEGRIEFEGMEGSSLISYSRSGIFMEIGLFY
jgi:TolB-like protein